MVSHEDSVSHRGKEKLGNNLTSRITGPTGAEFHYTLFIVVQPEGLTAAR